MASFNLSISPPQLELILKPGVTLTQAYDIVNNSDNVLLLTTSVDPWRPTDSNGSVTYDNISPSQYLHFSLANADIRLGQTFRLEPGAKRQLVLKIKSDSDALLTDNYYTFFVSQDATSTLNPDQTNNQLSARIGSHILISTHTTDSPEISLAVTNFTTTPRFKDILFTPITINGLLNNNSEFYFRPEGKITLTKNNLIIKELTLAPQNVLAHHSRSIQCLDDQQNTVPCSISPPFWPGLYTATINTTNTTVSTSFFVFPYYFTFALLTIGILATLILRFRRH